MTDLDHKKLERISFACAAQSPRIWLHQARILKSASERIDPTAAPGYWSGQLMKSGDSSILLQFRTYYFLLGLSFENLLKGLIIAHGKTIATDGKLVGKFKTHKLSLLWMHINHSRLRTAEGDVEILKRFEPYVEWAGRYPIAADADQMRIAWVHGDKEHDQELELWDRLAEHLSDIGWFVKGDGTRFNSDGSTEQVSAPADEV